MNMKKEINVTVVENGSKTASHTKEIIHSTNYE